MKKIKIGINGFGRIGRVAARIIFSFSDLELVAINSRADASSHAYLLKYDSTYGVLPEKIKAGTNFLDINGKKIDVYNFENPKDIPWDKSKVDIVIEASGKFREKESLLGHRQSGVKYVVLSAPAKDETKTLVLGVNHQDFSPSEDKIISNSSCTTNCLATTLKVLNDNFSVVQAFMTTIHAVTDSQNLLDNSHKKEIRLRRSAFLSLIPASTGSAKDIGKLFPQLSGKIICQAIRVPLPTVSLINLVAEVKKDVDKKKVDKAFAVASKTYLKGILAVASEELVSRDYTGSPYSSIVDSYLTKVLSERFISVFAWYDNEWGYASRLVEMVRYIGKKGGIV